MHDRCHFYGFRSSTENDQYSFFIHILKLVCSDEGVIAGLDDKISKKVFKRQQAEVLCLFLRASDDLTDELGRACDLVAEK